MIVDKKIEVKITKKNIFHYIQFFPDIKLKDIIEVDIENHLMKGSNKKINVKCDLCGIQRYINYQSYTKNVSSCLKYPIYTCDKCSHIKLKEYNIQKYGTEYYSQTKEYVDKFKNTMIERYGVEYALQSIELKEKQKSNNLEKYGVDNVFQLDKIKNKIKEDNLKKYGVEYYSQTIEHSKKFKNTVLKRYGVESPLQAESIREKSKKTMMEKYGVEIYAKSDEFLEKVKKTNLEKYGVEWIMKSSIFKSKSMESIKSKYGVDNIAKYEGHRKEFKISNDPNYIKYINNSISLLKCDKGHEFEIPSSIYNNRSLSNTPLCTICNPIGESSSIKENELFTFINDNYKGEIIKSYRDKLEIDIYIPDLKIGFEFNGLYWHSELYKENNYHLEKTNLFKSKGINLFHIWEDDWIYKGDIVKSMILNKLGKTPNKIFARKTIIKVIDDNKLVRDFLDKNHIQGFVGSKIKIGLFYNNELVSLMTFGNLRKSLGQKSEEGSYELLRFCNVLNTTVIGGASKLFKYFLNNYNPNQIISYSDLSRSNGNMYQQLGFKLSHNSDPNYYYIIDDVRKHRFNFRKDRLVKEGFNPNKTEIQIMNERGFYRIFDCGMQKWII